jgi:hypothetical protein
MDDAAKPEKPPHANPPPGHVVVVDCEVRVEAEEPEAAVALPDSVQWTLAVTRNLRLHLRELSRSDVGSARVAAAYANLAALVEGYERRIGRLLDGGPR